MSVTRQDSSRGRSAADRFGVASLVGGNPSIAPDQHPTVQQAQALLDAPNLNLSYTVITAPSDGVVTKVEQLQVGDYIAASTPAFALISNHDLWVEATSRKSSSPTCARGRPPAWSSTPTRQELQRKVASVSPGTGSQFSVLPPENATGNWVKVVPADCRLRVEIEDAGSAYPLHAGLSANVTVDTGHRRRLLGYEANLARAKPPDERGYGFSTWARGAGSSGRQ